MQKQESYRSGELAFTKKEFSKLLGVIDILEDELLFKLEATTGIRREDICNIKNDDIHLMKMSCTSTNRVLLNSLSNWSLFPFFSAN